MVCEGSITFPKPVVNTEKWSNWAGPIRCVRLREGVCLVVHQPTRRIGIFMIHIAMIGHTKLVRRPAHQGYTKFFWSEFQESN